MTRRSRGHFAQGFTEIPGASPHATLAARVLRTAWEGYGLERFLKYVSGPCGEFWCGAMGLSGEAVYEAVTALDRSIDYPPYEPRRHCGMGCVACDTVV